MKTPLGTSPVRTTARTVLALAFWASALISATPAADAQPQKAPGGGVLIEGVTIVSPERPAPLEGAYVGIRDGRIAFVGSGEAPPETEGWTPVDGGGAFLIPGLIDSHVHLESVPGMIWDQKKRHPKLVEAYWRQLPRSYLFHGFTTVVDLTLGDQKFLREFRRSPAAPDVLTCSHPLVFANGYPMAFQPERIRFRNSPNFLYDPAQADSIPKAFKAADHTPAAAVARVKEAGGICVKTFVEDGFGPQKIWPVPSVELLQEVAAAAREAQLPFLAHANSFDAYQRAVDGGAEILVHGLWTWDRHTASDQGRGLPPALVTLIERLVKTGTATMPTLQVIAGDRAMFDATYLKEEALSDVLPRELIAWLATPEGRWYADRLLQDLPPGFEGEKGAYDLHTRVLSRAERVVGEIARRGGRILFGSDTPSGPGFGNVPGYNGLLELRRLAAAGLSLDALFSAATLDNARAFQLEDRYGSVEVGKVANLLLVTKNPLKTVDAYGAIETVVLHGRFLPRESLAADR